MEKVASRVETRRYAAYMGATTEFRKMEGIDINYDGANSGAVPFMNVAMSEIGKGMADDIGDIPHRSPRIVDRFIDLAKNGGQGGKILVSLDDFQ